MKRIGIDCRMWNETGIGRYVRNIVAELAKQDAAHTYLLFYYDDSFLSVTLPPNFVKIKAPIRWHTFGEQLSLPLIYLRAHLDLLYVPHFNVPVFYPKKFICTIHDLTILHVKTGRATTLPYPVYWLKRLAFRFNIYSTILRSAYIFTVSKYVNSEILATFKKFGLNEKKIGLTVNAVDAKFKPVADSEAVKVLARYNIKKPYLFYVGNAHPHKNLDRLVLAFKDLAIKHPDLTLVLGGGKDFFYTRMEQELAADPILPRVKFIGFVRDEDLPALYSSAACFVNPSMYEGFGLQILEAFACGTKVACSNTTSLPEVSGGKACYFDPYNIKEMAAQVTACLTMPKTSYTAILKNYNWEDSARVVLTAINKLV